MIDPMYTNQSMCHDFKNNVFTLSMERRMQMRITKLFSLSIGLIQKGDLNEFKIRLELEISFIGISIDV